MVNLENEHIKLGIKTKGAELSSIYHKKQQREVLWQGHKTYWTGQAPILFPIVGELKNGKTQINGTEFKMTRHGFIKKMEADEIIEHQTSATFIFKSNTETLKQYPFEFTLKVTFEIDATCITNSFEIENHGPNTMPFNIGGHPAFALDENVENYCIVFEKEEKSSRHVLDQKGLYSKETIPMLNGNKLPLTKDIFNNDALVFKDLKSNQVSIENNQGERLLQMDFKGWPYFGIWSKPNAPYVCLEPWIGCADTFDASGEFTDKEELIHLSPNQSISFNFSIMA
ncbi:MAG: aldose 1-epimerase family protein [Bacteroidia bacterium]